MWREFTKVALHTNVDRKYFRLALTFGKEEGH